MKKVKFWRMLDEFSGKYVVYYDDNSSEINGVMEVEVPYIGDRVKLKKDEGIVLEVFNDSDDGLYGIIECIRKKKRPSLSLYFYKVIPLTPETEITCLWKDRVKAFKRAGEQLSKFITDTIEQPGFTRRMFPVVEITKKGRKD